MSGWTEALSASAARRMHLLQRDFDSIPQRNFNHYSYVFLSCDALIFELEISFCKDLVFAHGRSVSQQEVIGANL